MQAYTEDDSMDYQLLVEISVQMGFGGHVRLINNGIVYCNFCSEAKFKALNKKYYKHMKYHAKQFRELAAFI